MLVLSRKQGESLAIGDDITITINRVSGNRVTIGIEAPRDVRIVRGELIAFEESSDPEPRGSRAMPSIDSGLHSCIGVTVFDKADQ